QKSDLIDALAVVTGPAAPLMSVDRAQISVLVCPFVPDAHAVFAQEGKIGVAFEEPQKFNDDRAQVKFFCRETWKTLSQTKAHLVPEDALGTGIGAVALDGAVFLNQLKELQVLLHRVVSFACWAVFFSSGP